MTIRTIAFDPIRVEVDGVEVDTFKASYLEKDGVTYDVTYVTVNGEKIAIQRDACMDESAFKSSQLDVKALEKRDATPDQPVVQYTKEQYDAVWANVIEEKI